MVGPQGPKTKPAPLILRGQPLPWVSRAEHLGHTLCEDGTSAQDCREKRAQFIDSSVKIRESFDFAHPAEKIMTVDKYCSAAYGSNLWKHTETEAKMYTNAWRTGHKIGHKTFTNHDLSRLSRLRPRGVCGSIKETLYLISTILAVYSRTGHMALLVTPEVWVQTHDYKC